MKQNSSVAIAIVAGIAQKLNTPQRIQHHPTLRPHRLFQSGRLIKVLLFKPILPLSPNLAGPEILLLIDVLTKVPDDIGFLEEETHGV